MIDISVHIERVARVLLGEPNRALSKGEEWRFGAHGSLAVMVKGPKVGTWFDHENQIGGGVRELLLRDGVAEDGIADWFRAELGIDVNPAQQHVVATYDYVDEAGALSYQVKRFGPRKTFKQCRPDGRGGIIWNLDGVGRVPYHLDEVVAAIAHKNGHPPRIYVVEGEKDADRLRQWGVIATCNPGGANKWQAEFGRYFIGAETVVIADNDEPGRKHAAAVARALLPFAAIVKLVELEGLDDKEDVSDWIAAGGTQSDLETLVETTEPYDENTAPPRRFRFPMIRFNDIELTTSSRCIVEDLIPRESLVVVWGPPKCGKSFWVFDMVMHVALGRDYRGKQVEQGAIAYIAAEGELGIKVRALAFRQARMAEDEDPPFYLLTTRLDLVADLDELILDLKAQLPDEQCSIIVLDTLNRTIRGSENKDDDMGAYRDAADRLREEFHCAVIIIHHCGTAGDRPRGHTSLTGAIDAQFSVKRDVDNSILVSLELMKDGEEGGMMRGALRVVEVGEDDNGKPITSCVIEHLDAPTAATRTLVKPKKLPAAQARALAMLNEAILTASEIPPACNHIPSDTRCVREELWRRYCYQGGISAGDTQQARHKAYSKAAETLIADGLVGAWDDWRWVV